MLFRYGSFSESRSYGTPTRSVKSIISPCRTDTRFYYQSGVVLVFTSPCILCWKAIFSTGRLNPLSWAELSWADEVSLLKGSSAVGWSTEMADLSKKAGHEIHGNTAKADYWNPSALDGSVVRTKSTSRGRGELKARRAEPGPLGSWTGAYHPRSPPARGFAGVLWASPVAHWGPGRSPGRQEFWCMSGLEKITIF